MLHPSITITRQYQINATKYYKENTEALRVYSDRNNQTRDGPLADNERKLRDGRGEDHTATPNNFFTFTFLITARSADIALNYTDIYPTFILFFLRLP